MYRSTHESSALVVAVCFGGVIVVVIAVAVAVVAVAVVVATTACTTQ